MPTKLHGTLTANTVRSVTIDAPCQMITVTNRTLTGAIFFTVDGSIPTVAGDDTYVALGTKIAAVPNVLTSTVVRLISTTANDYSVIGEPV